MNLKELVTNPDTAYIITLFSLIFGTLGFLFGLISTVAAIFGIKSYFDQKKTNGAYKLLLENASRDFKGKLTENEINELNRQLTTLTNQITRDIPYKARKTVLEYKLDNVESEIHKLCDEHKNVRLELKKLIPENCIEIDENLSTYIDKEVRIKSGYQRLNVKILLIVLVLLFLSQSFVSSIFKTLISDTIYVINAKLYVEHVTTYLMGIITVCYIIFNFKIPKIDTNIKINKINRIIIASLLIIIWCLLVYFISFNVFITDIWIQIFVGIISMFMFSFGLKIIVNVFKK